MAARAIWKGVIRFGRVEVPVKLYSAVQDRKVRFRLLDARDLTPVEQRMVDPGTGKEVPAKSVQKGFATGDGRFVVLDEEELEALEPEPSRDIRVTRFVDPTAISQQWYERPYYLGPDGDGAAYFALAAALAKEGKEGVARWVMRNKEYVGALVPEGDYLSLVTLRHAGEVVEASELPAPGGRAPEPQEIRMAEQLVDALSGDFDPKAFEDEYRERVLELVEAKAKGKAVDIRTYRRKAARDEDLGDALEKSLQAAREKAA